MKDLWAGVRKYRDTALSAADTLDDDLYQYFKWIDGLLTDADALLTMKENIQSVIYYLTIELKDTEGDGPEFQVLQRLVNILTALPEHLKAEAYE